mgnify:CR=1 FL=1
MQKEAMINRDEEKLSSLRFLWSQIRNIEIDKKSELNDEEIQTVVARLVKQQQDALKDFVNAGRSDLQTKTEIEIKFLQSFLPEQISDADLETVTRGVVDKIGAVGPTDIGRIMGMVMKEVKGRADGNRVREVVSRIIVKT